MTGSLYVVVALFLGVLLYVVLRGRSSRQRADDVAAQTKKPLANGELTPGNTMGTDVQSPSDAFLRPATLTKSVPPLTQPRTGSSDSGSSHPAYPVAPAKYAEYTPKGGSAQRREVPQSPQPAARAAVPQTAKPIAPNATAVSGTESQATAPWYPEPPANYTESGTETQRTSAGKDPDLPRTS